MNDLRDLYQEMILDHSKRPRNFGSLAQAARRGEGYNPLCGDRLTLYLDLEGGVIKDIKFEGSGCAISKASASMMTAAVKGKGAREAERLFERFHAMLSREQKGAFDDSGLGKLSVFSGVNEFPARVKCATLAWHTLRSALRETGKPVSTE